MEWKPKDGGTHGSLYTHLNHTLKSADRDSLQPWFRYPKLFLIALAKLSVAQPQVV
jgi:hypothetical protein